MNSVVESITKEQCKTPSSNWAASVTAILPFTTETLSRRLSRPHFGFCTIWKCNSIFILATWDGHISYVPIYIVKYILTFFPSGALVQGNTRSLPNRWSAEKETATHEYRTIWSSLPKWLAPLSLSGLAINSQSNLLILLTSHGLFLKNRKFYS